MILSPGCVWIALDIANKTTIFKLETSDGRMNNTENNDHMDCLNRLYTAKYEDSYANVYWLTHN